MGMVHLLRGEDEAAAVRLRRAVTGMRGTDRMLEVPAAAVLLAEAEWRLGRDDAADAAADWALDASKRHASQHCLLRALEQFPAVAARRLDAERDVDGPWHDIGRLLRSGGRELAADRPQVTFHDLGEPEIRVAGAPVRPRIRKSYELLAYLVTHPGRRVDRDELLTALFGGRDDASTRSYLRQALRHLRDALPDEAGLVFEDGRLELRAELAVQTTSQHAESLLSRAVRIGGSERLEALRAAIVEFDRGEYLSGVASDWVAERRVQFAALACDARHEAAQAAYDAGRHREAEAWANDVLRVDPYREATWRLLMRVAHAAGDEDRVIAVYRRCDRTLRAVGAAPAHSTSELLTALRR
jgi:DNA-binding SARP family transcriptional activator